MSCNNFISGCYKTWSLQHRGRREERSKNLQHAQSTWRQDLLTTTVKKSLPTCTALVSNTMHWNGTYGRDFRMPSRIRLANLLTFAFATHAPASQDDHATFSSRLFWCCSTHVRCDDLDIRRCEQFESPHSSNTSLGGARAQECLSKCPWRRSIVSWVFAS